jgi:hypothetical protein
MLPFATFTIASSGLLLVTWNRVNKTTSKSNILLIIRSNSTNNHHSSSFGAITCNLSEAKIKGKEYNTKWSQHFHSVVIKHFKLTHEVFPGTWSLVLKNECFIFFQVSFTQDDECFLQPVFCTETIRYLERRLG